jgi:hypothetical protein
VGRGFNGTATAATAAAAARKKYFVPSMFDIAVWSEHRICVTAAKLTVTYSDDATVRISYLATWCLVRAMLKVKVTL